MSATIKHLPDLLTGNGVSCGPGWQCQFKTVEATSVRGQAFLTAFHEAMDEQCCADTTEDDDGYVHIDYLSFTPEEFVQFARQASLAAVSMGELRDFPDYDSWA